MRKLILGLAMSAGALAFAEQGLIDYENTLRDHCWMWGHDSGFYDGKDNRYNIPVSEPITMADACAYMGIPNCCAVTWDLPSDQYLESFRKLKRVSWVVAGAEGKTLDEKYRQYRDNAFNNLLGKLPNLVGLDIDDYFLYDTKTYPVMDIIDDQGKWRKTAQSRFGHESLVDLCERTARYPRKVELRLVHYIDRAKEADNALYAPALEKVDTVMAWTWTGDNIGKLEPNFRRCRALAPNKRILMGIYMWDFGGKKPLDMQFMRAQLDIALKLYKERQIDGLIFHCTPLVNKVPALEAVEYARQWLKENGDFKRAFTVKIAEGAAPIVIAAAKDMERVLKQGGFAAPITIEVGFKSGAGSQREFDGKTLSLFGDDKFNTAGAVYDFLEKNLGCRWYWPFAGGEVIPDLSKVELKPFTAQVQPALECRWLQSYSRNIARKRNADWFSIRNALNFTGYWDVYQNIDLSEGVKAVPTMNVLNGDYCHSLDKFIPPHKSNKYGLKGLPKEGYFAIHPEWFTLRKSGKSAERVDYLQLCFSNAELRKELSKNFFQFVEKRGGKGIFNISATDIPGSFCDCDECQALVKQYGCDGAPLFLALSEISFELKRRYPEALISTLIYHRTQSQTPPNDKFPGFADNLLVTFAPIDDDFSKPMTHPNNQVSLKDLKGWTKYSKHIWSWYYATTYSSCVPIYSGIRRNAADIRAMLACGIHGQGFEHDVGRDCGGCFFDLQSWVFAKLFREPNLDEDQLVREYFDWAYGPAAKLIYEFYDELETMNAKHDKFMEFSKQLPDTQKVSNIVKWARLFDAAEKLVAGDAFRLQRVRECRLGVDYALLTKCIDVRAKTDYPYTIDETLCRATNTLAKAYAVRSDGKAPEANLIPQFEHQYLNGQAAKFVPEGFEEVPITEWKQSLTTQSGRGYKMQPMDGAVLGRAIWDPEENASVNSNLEVCVYDRYNNKFPLTRKIMRSEMKGDGFHLYKIGKVRLSPDTDVVPGGWRMSFKLADCFSPGEDEEWIVYLSAKFEGPKYIDGSTLPNRAAFDRVVLRKVKP